MLNYVHVIIYATGLLAWVMLAVVGLSAFADRICNWVIIACWTKQEFFAFVADRLKRKHPFIPG